MIVAILHNFVGLYSNVAPIDLKYIKSSFFVCLLPCVLGLRHGCRRHPNLANKRVL